MPENRSVWVPERLTTTGNVAAPSLLDVATMPTEATVPAIASVAPDGVTATDWPALRPVRSALPTLPSSFQVAVEMTLNWADAAVFVEALPFWLDVERDEEDDPPPVTLSPSSAVTSAIVPAIGERSTAEVRFCWALVSAACAEETCARAEAIAAELPPPETTSSRFARAWVRFARATSTALPSSVSSTRASRWFFLTLSPAFT